MKLTLNLASKNYINRRKLYATYGVLMAFFGIVLAVNVVSVIHTRMQMRTIRGHLQEIGVASVEKQAVDPAEVDQLLSQIAFANKILGRESFRWTELLNHLEDVVRRGITVQSLKPDYRDGSLRVTGLARNLDDLKSFISRIQSSSHFETVYLFEQNRVKVGSERGRKKAAIDFSLQLKGAF